MDEIKNSNILERCEDIVFNKLDDELVMMSIANGEYYGLDTIGTRIWELLENKMTFGELLQKLCDEYNVSEEQCKDDTITFLNSMIEKKLVKVY